VVLVQVIPQQVVVLKVVQVKVHVRKRPEDPDHTHHVRMMGMEVRKR
jgi:hypothetical protein